MVRPCFVSGATFNGDYLQTLDLRNCDFIQACLCKNNIFVQIIETGHIFFDSAYRRTFSKYFADWGILRKFAVCLMVVELQKFRAEGTGACG